MGTMTPITYNDDLAREIIHFGVLAADVEALKPRPASSVPNPDGSAQYETNAEYTRRIISAAILHLIHVGLLDMGLILPVLDVVPVKKDSGHHNGEAGGHEEIPLEGHC